MKRKDAIALGLKTYNTGKPCKHGHFSDRYVQGACIECVRIQTQKWKANNPEKQKQAMRKWLENNRKIHAARVKRWQTTNKDKMRAAAKNWRVANSEKVAARTKRYRNANPDKVTAWAVAGIAKRAKRVPKWLSKDDKWMLREAYALARQRTQMFGFAWEVDHIIPLRGATVSGLHVPTNVQVIPKVLIRLKSNTFFTA
jgi:hypothetical protein